MRLSALSGWALLGLAVVQPGAVLADNGWETVVRDRNRQVQIDRGSIIQSDRGTKVAWARVLLSPAESAAQGYSTIQALNRFDCLNRSITTVKRRYLDERSVVVREEDVVGPAPQLVTRNSVDERLWREVCGIDSDRLAEELARVAAVLAAQPAARSPAPAVSETSLRPVVVPQAAVEAPEPVRPAARPAQPEVAVRDAAPTAVPTPAPPPRSVASAAPTVVDPPATPSPAALLPPRSWTYTGETGPEYWGRMRPEWSVCDKGSRQSPIDLRDGIAVDLEPVVFDYRPTRFLISDVGHTLEVHVGEGLGVLIRGQRYDLVHFQFHRPAEELVAGHAYDMAVHLHHRDADGRMAVVVILLEAGDQPQPLIQTLWNSMPLDRGDHYMPTATIDPSALVPVSPAHFLYMGSLTTPPCTEGVLRVVMKDPVTVSHEQMRIFGRIFPPNRRPAQSLNGRVVLESR